MGGIDRITQSVAPALRDLANRLRCCIAVLKQTFERKYR